MARSPKESPSTLRKLAIGLVAAIGFVIAWRQLDSHYAIKDWLFWVYARIWLECGVWVVACLATGHDLVRRRGVLPLAEHCVLAFAVGVLVFVFGIFTIGLFQGLGPWTFVAWPIAMLAFGCRSSLRFARRVRRHLRAFAQRPRRPRSMLGAYAIFLFGALGVLALYFNILTPANVAYDSRWYHLGIAEHYAAAHAVTRFPEGWFMGALPQLASYVYTWAFMAPASTLATHIELAAHLEFVLFLATLAGIAVLARWLLAGLRVPLAWTGLFLFPGIFIYDSSLSAAADHVLAFWAAPLVLAARTFFRSWAVKDACLLAAMAAGAALTKYQSIYLLLPIALAVAWNALALLSRRRSVRAALVGVGVCAAAFTCFTSIHWLKNLVWYGDPLYPRFHELLEVRPWNPNAEPDFHLPQGFIPQGTFSQRLLETAKAVTTFAFQPHDWAYMHRDWPVFGFLFTLLIPFVVLLRGARRLRALSGATLLGVFIWYWTLHEDRYLQALVPWMAAFVAAVIVRLWHNGLVGRLSIVPLVALQVIWGGDHYFFPTHGMAGQHPARISMEMISSGFAGRLAERFAQPSNLVKASSALPSAARVLIHEQHLRLGIGRPSVGDARGTQGGLSYRRARSPRQLWQRLRELGVTHVVWPAPMSIETWADETIFYDFVTNDLRASKHLEVTLAALPTSPPSAKPYGPVAALGCRVTYRGPVRNLDAALGTPNAAPSPADLDDAQRLADFILLESACRKRLPQIDAHRFRLATARSGWETWVRRR